MRGVLRVYRDEPVGLMTETVTEDSLGDTVSAYTPLRTVQANVQPLGNQEKAQAGLRGDSEALRVQFTPAEPIDPGDHLTVRGVEMAVLRAEVWQSYSACIVEPA